MTTEKDATHVVHLGPLRGSVVTRCCEMGLYGIPKTDSMTYTPANVTCAGPPTEDETCGSCGEEVPGDCPKSERPCGHHCNHVSTHDECDWCGLVFDDDHEQVTSPGPKGRCVMAEHVCACPCVCFCVGVERHPDLGCQTPCADLASSPEGSPS